MSFYDFEGWSDVHKNRVNEFQHALATKNEEVSIVVQSVLLACIITSRGRRLSPSSILEKLNTKKRPSNPQVIEGLRAAWNVMVDVDAIASDRVDTLISLITPKHRNSTGSSETLKYQVNQTHEAFIDYWVTVADIMTGIRAAANKVFGISTPDLTSIGTYLNQGISRSKLLAAFGHELKSADLDEEDTNEESEED